MCFMPFILKFCESCQKNRCEKNVQLNRGHFEPLYLPPYSPDLTPIERVWLLIKAAWFVTSMPEIMNNVSSIWIKHLSGQCNVTQKIPKYARLRQIIRENL